jgi:hypothetical protein
VKNSTENSTEYGGSRGRASGQLLSLAGGLLSADLLLNLPRLSAPADSAGYLGSWAASLLVPSIDLLMVAAILLIGAQSGDAGRRASRILAAAVIALFDLYAALSRLGTAPALLAAALPAAAVAGLAGWLAAGLVVRGFQSGLTRNAFIALVAVTAILHVALAGRILAPSVVPRMARGLASLFR